jgi:uncharacterized protein (TIGR03437 family)
MRIIGLLAALTLGLLGGASTMHAAARGDDATGEVAVDGVTAGPPASVSFIGGTQTGGAGSQITLTAEVLDAQRIPVSGATIAFAAANAAVTPASAATDAAGRATTRATLGSTGTATVTATVSGIPAATANITVASNVPPPSISAVLKGASFRIAISPGSWMTLVGSNFAASEAQATFPLPTILGGVRVRVNNSVVPVYYVSPGQINVQLPYEVRTGQTSAVVEVNGTDSLPLAFQVIPAAPGIFMFGNNRAVVQNADAQGGVTLNTANNPIQAGGVILVYFTGQGPLDNPIATGGLASGAPLSRVTAAASVTIGGKPAQALFLGMTPGYVALAQGNIVVPGDLPTGDYPVVITIDGVQSNGPVISVTGK